MNREDVTRKLRTLVVEQFGVDEEEVTEDAHFSNDLGADSLDTIELVMAAEEDFGIEISDEEAETMTTVKEAIDFVTNKVRR